MKKILLLLSLLLQLVSSAQMINLYNFDGPAHGREPYGGLTSDGTYLYGTTYLGGSGSGFGNLFKIKMDGTGFDTVMTFRGVWNGRHPAYGTPYYDGTYLYGMTSEGGVNDVGVIYKVKPDGTGFMKLMDFAGVVNGGGPFGSLISDGTYLYGMTYGGGTNDYGTIFRIMTDGTNYQKLLDFNGTLNGRYPYGSLWSDGTFLYGMTFNGGTSNMGCVFKIKPDGTMYQKLLDMTGTATGQNPYGVLISDGTYLYGTTYNGGIFTGGALFRIKYDGTGFQKIFNFSISTGTHPIGSLVFNGTALYGTTSQDGSLAAGTIYRIMPDGSGYTNLYNQDNISGVYSQATLYSDGTYLYGTGLTGGTFNFGTLFKFTMVTTGLEEEENSSISVYPNPAQDVLNIGSEQSGKFCIYNYMGALITSGDLEHEAKLDIRSFSAGMYFLRLNGGVKRFLVEK